MLRRMLDISDTKQIIGTASNNVIKFVSAESILSMATFRLGKQKQKALRKHLKTYYLIKQV